MTDQKVTEERRMTDEQKKLFEVLSPLQQRMAINHLSGVYGSARECYVEAGGQSLTDSAKDSAASVMLNNVKVQSFISAMKEVKVIEAIMTREEMSERLTNLSRTGMSDLIEWGEQELMSDEGISIIQSNWKVKDEAMIDPDKMASIAELSSTPMGIKIKQHSPLQAMKQLADMQGYNAAKEIKITKDEELTPFDAITAGEDEKED